MYTVPELHARYPHIPVWTIRYACRNGLISGARLAGRVWLIPPRAGDKWAVSYVPYGNLRKSNTSAGITTPTVTPRSHPNP
jgi:hypothetical protein